MTGNSGGAAVAVLALTAMLSACAYQPIVDRGQPGFDAAKYDRDLAECRGYAEQVDVAGETATSTFLTAAVGAALGAVVGAFGGNAGEGAAFGAAIGGTAGAVSGAGKATDDKENVLRRCLYGRGYSVLR